SCALERELDLRTPSASALQRDLEAWLKKRPDAPNTQGLSATMHELFGDRIAKKSQLIESVREGSVRLAQLPVVLKPPTERSMPEGPISRTLKDHRAIVVALMIATLVVAGAVAFIEVSALRPQVALPIVYVPPPIDTPASAPEVELEEEEPASPVAPATEPKSAPPARRRAQKGRLTLDTTPWTQVWLQGRNLGDTPLLEKLLPAGKHTLKLLNPDKGIKQVVEVEVQPGQTTVLKLRL
ncbi:MAG: hypothetical protein JNK82_10395, partial [Myxococcaceae bacterium]|nr:hypothetical protein [Myxococcaceae bacterium]